MEQLGFTPEKVVRGWERIIDAFAAAFPQTSLDLDVHLVLDADRVVTDVFAPGREKVGPRFGPFGGWLSGRPAEEDTHHAGMHEPRPAILSRDHHRALAVGIGFSVA